MSKIRYLFPLIFFIGLIVLFKIGLINDPNLLPSMLINRKIPNFEAQALDSNQGLITENELKGKIVLFNVWSSWCQNCQIEHPLLIDLAKSGLLEVYSLNYKDNRLDAISFLKKMGNPYKATIYDPEGKLAMQFGVYGTPESFLIDQNNIVRYRYAGPLTLDVLEKDLLPKIKRMSGSR